MTDEAALPVQPERKRRAVLELTHEEARRFFLKAESYCNFDFPPYIAFDSLLAEVDAFLAGKRLSDFGARPNDYEGVNYILLNNKDGKYAWRPMQLIHPAIYVSLVHAITAEDKWRFIVERFSVFSEDTKIKCLSLPVESLSDVKDKAEQITSWWQQVELKSIELSLDYQYVLQTDISDCYGSIYTHSVSWALHTKLEAKKNENRNNQDFIGVVIDKHLQNMSNGHTNGIPQGSVVMDFIAEIILGYADLELSQKLAGLGITDYQILRYRDDYRVFVNNSQDGEKILKSITEIMIDLGMKLNPSKTSVSSSVIKDSIKKDKLVWMANKQRENGLQKHLLIIHQHAEKFPNAGSLTTSLSGYYKRLCGYKSTKESVLPIIAIAVDIAYHNPKTYPVISAILSKLVSMLKSDTAKREVVDKIKRKFDSLPNTSHMQIWLQRVSHTFAPDIEYDSPICKLVSGAQPPLWNMDWISFADLRNLIKPEKIIDRAKLANLVPVVPVSEVAMFNATMQAYFPS